MTYRLMKAKIQRSDLQDQNVVDSLYIMLDTFLIGNRIAQAQYDELVAMLPANNIEDITIE